MSKYRVTMIQTASTSVEVEADSVEDAREQALNTDEAMPILCHQCACEVELGDTYQTIVYDENDNEVGEAK